MESVMRKKESGDAIIVYFREIVEEWLAFSKMFLFGNKTTYINRLKAVRLLYCFLNKLKNSARHSIFITWIQQEMLRSKHPTSFCS